MHVDDEDVAAEGGGPGAGGERGAGDLRPQVLQLQQTDGVGGDVLADDGPDRGGQLLGGGAARSLGPGLHGRRGCHRLAAVVAVVLVGCAPKVGWERTDRRTCVPAEPPRMCVSAAPDRQLVVRAGGEVLVPGECMVAPADRGGRLWVTATDGRAGVTKSRWIRVRRGAVTTVELGPKKLAIAERTEC